MTESQELSGRALAYHERTKHRPRRFAASLGYLDWETQPDPFRTYEGARRVELPLDSDLLETKYDELFHRGAVAPSPLSLSSIGTFFELALGITAWKRFQSARWALRANPSSGNLHPTEGWALLPEIEGLHAGIHHYMSRDHVLEERCAFAGAEDAAAMARRLGAGGFLVILSTIHWREAWKYGERAFRYCQHDLGHALGSLRFAAAALGWSAAHLDGFGDDVLASLLGLDREADFRDLEPPDRESPETALWIAPETSAAAARSIEAAADEFVGCASRGIWTGRPNVLSGAHVDWPAIDDVAEATRRPFGPGPAASPGVALSDSNVAGLRDPLLPVEPMTTDAAASVILRRRSAVAFDGKTSIAAPAFFRMLDAVVPRTGAPPWDAFPAPARIHLGIFVHRVRGLEPGLYLLERDPAAHAELRAALRPDAVWARVPGTPEPMHLHLLIPFDLRDTARAVSCAQDIAADGAFSLGMLASFEPVVRGAAWEYRRLFWEAGLVGQVLYLEAEAAGVRATGIGCYFDDVFHELLGLRDARFQSMYHFTVGGPVEDSRLQTEPAHAHLGPARSRGRAPRS